MFTVCIFFWLWCYFDFVKWVKFQVSKHFLTNARRNGLIFCMLMYLDHLWNWLDYGHGLLICLLILMPFWFSETGKNWVFLAFSWECSRDCIDIGHGLLIFRPSSHWSVSFCVCLSICLSLCLSSNWPWSSKSNFNIKVKLYTIHSLWLVHAITHPLFTLGSPNLDQRCKTPWSRSLLFWERDWPLPSSLT